MEGIASRWKKLSLSDMEGKNVDLSKEKKRLELVLTAKFLTRRSINIEVARTFRPIWRTRRNFEVSVVGDNVVLIAFELEVDVEKVLKGELLTYDRHLVVLQRYEGSTQVSNLCFNTTSFWVQIHNLPFSLLTVEATFSLRETIGTVLKLKDTSKMKKGSFM
nr:hypothetical protein CFP56_78248 [Quercus suber]